MAPQYSAQWRSFANRADDAAVEAWVTHRQEFPERGEEAARRVMSGSGLAALWRCRTDRNHMWVAKINSRLKADFTEKKGCAVCATRT